MAYTFQKQIDFLLEHACPSIKYLVHRDMLNVPVNDPFIVVFAHKCEDNSRKVMDITECEVTPEGKTFYRCLYRYNITENIYDGNKFIIKGEFEKVNTPSEYLQTLLTRSGVPQEELSKFTRKEMTVTA